jgi:hypothetical protein
VLVGILIFLLVHMKHSGNGCVFPTFFAIFQNHFRLS